MNAIFPDLFPANIVVGNPGKQNYLCQLKILKNLWKVNTPSHLCYGYKE